MIAFYKQASVGSSEVPMLSQCINWILRVSWPMRKPARIHSVRPISGALPRHRPRRLDVTPTAAAYNLIRMTKKLTASA
jgi:hypothetical protein